MEQEIWKEIPRFNGRYEASNFGRIRTIEHYAVRTDKKKYLAKQTVLKPAINHSGYYRFAVKYNGKYWGRERIAKELGISSAHVKDIANNKNLWKEE